MLFPNAKLRQTTVRALQVFFCHEHTRDFDKALITVCRFYKLKRPKVVWWERFDDHRDAGACYPNGIIHLIWPGNWKRNRKHNAMNRWVEVALHEFGHFVLWSDAERKADVFMKGMLR